ncbi:MAG: 30S ribosomal protein S6 [Anaerolineae bacterium]|nr:30S ribosomal protein S6 [Anaerolineae bacterium]
MVTRNYELMFIVSLELDEKATESLLERIRGYLKEAQATLLDFKDWRVRRLAYPIKGQREGRYYLAHFTMETEQVQEFERRLRLAEGVIRELITIYEGPVPEAASHPVAEQPRSEEE